MIPGIVLAAGASERMGAPKPLVQIGGRPAVEHVVSALRAAGAEPVHVVLGAAADEVLRGADLSDAIPVRHMGWAAGRTSSLQAGLSALSPGVEAVVLALVDMPLVTPDTVRALLAAWEAADPRPDVVLPVHAGRHGHPIVLAAELFGSIANLGPDQPLRDVVRPAVGLEVQVADAGILVDLDTPDDLRRALGDS